MLLEKNREVFAIELPFTLLKLLLIKKYTKLDNFCAIPMLGLMLLNYILTRCVNLLKPDFIRVGISVRKPIDQQLDKTVPVALNVCSCTICNEKKQTLN